MDTRLLVIAAPLLVAGSWALFNIGRLAINKSNVNTARYQIQGNFAK